MNTPFRTHSRVIPVSAAFAFACLALVGAGGCASEPVGHSTTTTKTTTNTPTEKTTVTETHEKDTTISPK